MRSSIRTAGIIFATALLSIVPSFSSASAQASRIVAQAVSPSASRVALTNTVSPRTRLATDLGDAPADRTLSSVTIRFNMTAAQSAALDALIAAQQNPSSPSYHQWLTPEQYAAQFGLSSSDIAKVTSWLQSQGLTVTGVGRGRGFVTVSGTVGQLNAAFGTSIHNISLDGEQHISNLSEPRLPADIAAVTSTVTGLSDIRLKPHVQPHFTSSFTGNHYLAPGDFYTIYDMLPLVGSTSANGPVTGAGITIAVAGQTDILPSDVAAFRAASGLPANAPTIKLIGTDPGTPLTTVGTQRIAEDQIEASLDVEWSGAVAPAASILYVNSTDVIGTSLTQIIDQNLAPIATVSYGNCETGFGTANIATYNALFRQGTVQGQTIVGPTGDSGATDCDYQTNVATQGLAVDFPASSPYVTAVGGTMFNEGSGSYWAAANSTAYNTSTSALSYIPEVVWNESSSASGISAGGGGASIYFTKPAWQLGTGVPADFSRDTPDIAFNAAAAHDPYLLCQGGFCTNGFRDSPNPSPSCSTGNCVDVVGGTSVSTPAFAGMMALLEQKLNTRVGLANPTLYALANSTYYTNVFHDVTSGSNVSPCTIGTANCTNIVATCNGSANSSQGCIGYSAGVGYDLGSGWGSLDVFNFINDWPLVTPLSSGTNGFSVSATNLTSNTGSVIAGATITFTATITSATSGVTSTPSGTVQLLVDGTATGTAVALTSGSATLTYVSTGLSSGNHVFTAAYSGNSTYAGSKGTVTVDIVSASAPDFTLTPSTATITAASGASATGLTYTVTSVNGFAGAVNFTASSNSSLAASYTFSVTPVTLTSNGTGTTVFTLVASVSNGQTSNGLHKLGSASAANHVPSNPWTRLGLPATGITLAGLFLFASPRRRTRARSLLTALLFTLVSLGVLGAAGCGTTSTNPTTTTSSTNTPAGTYPVTVTASGTTSTGVALSHSSTVTFVVH